MLRRTLPVLTLLFFVACSKTDSAKSPELTNQQKAEIAKHADQLVNSINSFDFSVINETWSNEAFKLRFTNLTSAQKSTFDHIFKKDIERTIKVGNLAIIHTVNQNQGMAELFDLTHFGSYSEVTLLLKFESWFNFFKYRIEHRKGKSVICDYYQFTDDLWYSEKMLNALKMLLKMNI